MFRGLSCCLLRDFDVYFPQISVDFSAFNKLLISEAIKLIRLPVLCGALDARVLEFNVATTIP